MAASALESSLFSMRVATLIACTTSLGRALSVRIDEGCDYCIRCRQHVDKDELAHELVLGMLSDRERGGTCCQAGARETRSHRPPLIAVAARYGLIWSFPVLRSMLQGLSCTGSPPRRAAGRAATVRSVVTSAHPPVRRRRAGADPDRTVWGAGGKQLPDSCALGYLSTAWWLVKVIVIVIILGFPSIQCRATTFETRTPGRCWRSVEDPDC